MSGSEADDETQLTFYTEQYRSRRRSKGNGGLGKVPEPLRRRKTWAADFMFNDRP